MIQEYKNRDFHQVEKIYNRSKLDEFYGELSEFSLVPLSEDNEMTTLFSESQIYVYGGEEILGFCGHKGNYISWLFVDPEHRGKGVAEALLLHILPILESTASLTVLKSNKRAISLYAKLGFEVEREFETKYQGIPVVANKLVLNGQKT
jgi:ribosomal protein S18 acetylase RimI-like enzyme